MAKVKERSFECSDMPKKCFRFFRDMRNNKELCDLTFQVGSESISAHRIIITAAIPYFRDILSSKDQQRVEEGICMPDIEPSVFKSLIEFAYSCKVKIDMENAKSLLAAACSLGIDEIREKCCDYLADNLETENVISTRLLADKLNCPQLLNVIDCYVKENFRKVYQTKDFLSCSLTYVKDLISQDDLNVTSEKQVVDAVLKWVKGCLEDRIPELPGLLLEVRMPLLEPLCLTYIVEREELIRRSMTCRDLFEEAKNYNLFPPKRKNLCSFRTEPRQFEKTASAIQHNDNECIYKLQGEINYTVQHFDSKEKKWLKRESATFYQRGGCTAKLSSKIYYFNWGYTLQYDATSNVYKYLNNVPTARICAGASSLKDKIYVCGGRTEWTASNVVECFDPEKNKWTRVCNMWTSRWGLAVVAVGEYIFVLGGRDNVSVHDSVERYNPKTDKWVYISAMLSRRCFAGAATLNRKIYICGGRILPDESRGAAVATAEVYDTNMNLWEFISPMHTARHRIDLLSCCGKLYVLGGKDDKGRLVHTFEVYDPKTDEWTPGPSTDEDYFASGAVVLHSASP